MRHKPTPKQKQFVKEYIKNKFNGSKAALQVYDVKNKDSAKEIAHQNLQKEVVQNEVQRQLAQSGITLEYVNSTMYDAMEFNKQGKASQAVLADYVKHAHKLYNALPKDKKVVVKEERRVLLSKDLEVLKGELTTTVIRSQELLQDL